MKDLLERCETEMRYAGWTTLEVDNPQRQDLYFRVQAALAQQDGQSNFCAQCEAFARELKAVKPAQEPVGVFCEDDDIGYVRLIPHQQMKLKAWDKLYTAPQQRPWVGLTDEEAEDIWEDHQFNGRPSEVSFANRMNLIQAIEAKLKELNA